MAHATGITIIDDTIRVPTVLDAIDIVKAVKIVNIKLTVLTGIPINLAPSSSKAMYLSSLYWRIKVSMTNTIMTYLILKGTSDGILSNQIIEIPRSPFSV